LLRQRLRAAGLLFSVLAFAAVLAVPGRAAAAPQLRLPTPPGEDWRIIQGYGCGTHNGWDHYSLDLVRVHDSTYEAPIYAAADGIIWFWERYSGSLILSHGGGFFTIYTHLSRPVSAEGGRPVAAGEQIGWVSDTGSRGLAHLHFTAYYASSNGWSGRSSVPVSFSDGWSFAEIGGCNQHGGTVVRAAGAAVAAVEQQPAAETEGFNTAAPTLDFRAADGAVNYSMAWNGTPADDAVRYAVTADLRTPIHELPDGIHTLVVRSWFADGSANIAEFGPVMIDRGLPEFPAAAPQLINLTAGRSAVVSWSEAVDAVSGVAGYRIYLGTDPAGTSEWYVNEAVSGLPALAPGRYLLRLQPIDNAGLLGEWFTYAELTVTP
jgi:hypothetical protein